jgi:Fur family iron response transcriptional regulator
MKLHYYYDEILALCENQHLTVDAIFSHLSHENPQIWKSSIYRNVEDLVEKGSLKKLVWIGKKAYFETNKWPHIHLVDTHTGAILDFHSQVDVPSLPKNFQVHDMDLKIYGKFL